jgi:plastocyanin
MRVLKRLSGLHRAALAAVFGLLLGSLVLLGPALTAAADVSVNIVNFAFAPTPLTVPVGTTVVWTNQDFVVHTVTSDTGVWDSGSLSQGQSFPYTFKTPGTYAYHCIPHPYMMGTVTVTAAGASSGNSATPAAASGGFADPAFQQL